MQSGPETRALLKHFLASLAYRTHKVIHDAPHGFSEFRILAGVRTPKELICAEMPAALVPGEVATEIARAQRAFAARDYMIVIDNQRIDDPDATIIFHPHTEIEFIKILPLVGG